MSNFLISDFVVINGDKYCNYDKDGKIDIGTLVYDFT